MGEGGGEDEDLGLNSSLHVVNANRKGDGVTVLRGYLGAEPSVNKLSNPPDAGEVGDPDDNKFVNDFLGDITLLNFLPCSLATTGCCCISTSILSAFCGLKPEIWCRGEREPPDI